jgi:hypothetical protein
MNTPLAGKKRSFGRGILLVIVTLGIYGFYWAYKAYKEVYDQERRTDYPVAAFVLSIIPFINIIGIIWLHSIAGGAVQQARQAKGLPPGVSGGEFLLWLIPGILILVGPFVAYYKMQTSINEYWDACATHPPLPQIPPAGAPPMPRTQ